ncbi:MAG: hypothetical protein ACTSUE_23710 [Promethearchaeota archaeon]
MVESRVVVEDEKINKSKSKPKPKPKSNPDNFSIATKVVQHMNGSSTTGDDGTGKTGVGQDDYDIPNNPFQDQIQNGANTSVSHGTAYGGNDPIFNPLQKYQIRSKKINDLQLWREQEFIAENSTLVRFTSHMMGLMNAPLKYAFKEKHLDAWRVQQQLQKQKQANNSNLTHVPSTGRPGEEGYRPGNPTLSIDANADYKRVPEEVYDPMGTAIVLMKSETLAAIQKSYTLFVSWMTLVDKLNYPTKNELIIDSGNTGIWEIFAEMCAMTLKQIWFASANRLFTNKAADLNENQFIETMATAKQFLVDHGMRRGGEEYDILYESSSGLTKRQRRTDVQGLLGPSNPSEGVIAAAYMAIPGNRGRDIRDTTYHLY